MKRRLFNAIAVVCVATLGCAHKPATSAIIVRQGVYSREGVGAFEALSIQDAATVRQLESYFPSYRTMPGSSFAGLWMSGYEVYIDNGGQAVHIVVSYDSRFWTVGKGDLQVEGDFEQFVKQMQQKSARGPTRP